MGIISSKQQKVPTLLAPSMEGNLDEVKRLVGIYIADNNNKSGSNKSCNTALSSYINTTDTSGNAAVHGAVFAGHLDVLKFLVESCYCDDDGGGGGDGVDLQLKNGLGCSPLWIAAGYGRIECLEYLIDKLHNTNKLDVALLDANDTGDTPFVAAVSKGNINACKCLLSCVDEMYKPDSSAYWDMKCKILRTSNNSGDTALKVAVATGQGEELVTLLLEEDDLYDEWLAKQHSTTSSSACSSDKDYDVDNPMQAKSIYRKNDAGLSPLIIACERNLPAIAELLLKHGADLTIKDAKGRSPLSVASFCGCDDVVEFLLNKTDASTLLLNMKDISGCTPLCLASRTGNLSMVKYLVDAGADTTVVNNEGLTPQDVASKFKKDKVSEYFMQSAS